MHGSHDRSGAGSHVRLESMSESVHQRASGWCAGCVRDSNTEVVDSLCPVVLIVHLGDDDLGSTGKRRDRCGPRSAVMDNGSNPV